MINVFCDEIQISGKVQPLYCSWRRATDLYLTNLQQCPCIITCFCICICICIFCICICIYTFISVLAGVELEIGIQKYTGVSLQYHSQSLILSGVKRVQLSEKKNPNCRDKHVDGAIQDVAAKFFHAYSSFDFQFCPVFLSQFRKEIKWRVKPPLLKSYTLL